MAPGSDGAVFSPEWKDALWARFFLRHTPERQERVLVTADQRLDTFVTAALPPLPVLYTKGLERPCPSLPDRSPLVTLVPFTRMLQRFDAY